ncbi:MAG: aminoacyl-histidine dipeptidase [Schaedlerella sp.]|nr:aminoacyl-histidine dipeptidase [Schaedlerella sp.]
MLEGLNPKEVLGYFEKICSIPHGSGNTDTLADYFLDFAKENGLDAKKDNVGNIIIYKDATVGYEDHETVILQGHMDMVCDKIAECTLDMEQDGLELETDGKFVWAKGTTLGGDDGIALAYILAVLASKELSHPKIEALFTTDEETDMGGASGLETEYLNGRKLINIDSEEEGVLTVSCAGGVGVFCEMPVRFISTDNMNTRQSSFRISVEDLLGGHSGGEIHKPRQNAILLLAVMLNAIKAECDFTIAHFQGGVKDNAIPKSAEVIVCVDEENEEIFEELAIACAEGITMELEDTEPELSMVIEGILPVLSCMDKESTQKVLGFLTEVPNGVATMSQNIDGLVQTSSNLGIARTENENFSTTFLIRSSVTDEKEIMKNIIQTCSEKYGGKTEFDAEYPAWEYAEDSPLREKMTEVYEKMYEKQPIIEAVHAGLECGFFAEKIPGIDMVSFGPNLFDVHTPAERLEVVSVERCWEYLVKLLSSL